RRRHTRFSRDWSSDVCSSDLYSTPDWHLTGGNVMTTLVNQVDRDGFGDEPSTEYNSYWLQQIMDVADVLQGYDRYPKADLYNNEIGRASCREREATCVVGA